MTEAKGRHIIDLSNCYSGNGAREFDRNSVDGIRKSLGHCHDVNQVLIRNQNVLQKRFMDLRLRNGIIIAVITGAIARGPEIFAFIERLLR
jgi:hypothetical protein